ncbi:MAG TPA: hypothetical protein PLW81_10220 [Thiobacillaceae bacterium]|nr:hypothetical protein [Thiobacillaceae bacterium]
MKTHRATAAAQGHASRARQAGMEIVYENEHMSDFLMLKNRQFQGLLRESSDLVPSNARQDVDSLDRCTVTPGGED